MGDTVSAIFLPIRTQLSVSRRGEKRRKRGEVIFIFLAPPPPPATPIFLPSSAMSLALDSTCTVQQEGRHLEVAGGISEKKEEAQDIMDVMSDLL